MKDRIRLKRERVDTPEAMIIYPNGGEVLAIGCTVIIEWMYLGLAGDIHIEYSVDGGTVWADVIASTPNIGDYEWTVPNEVSANCLVKITGIAGQIATDKSGAVFEIA